MLKAVVAEVTSAARRTRLNVSSGSRSVKLRENLDNRLSNHNRLSVAMRTRRNSSSVTMSNNDVIRSNNSGGNSSDKNSSDNPRNVNSVGNSNGRNRSVRVRNDNNVGNSSASSRNYNVEMTSSVATTKSDSSNSAGKNKTSKETMTGGATRNVCEIGNSSSNRTAIVETGIVTRTGNVAGNRISNDVSNVTVKQNKGGRIWRGSVSAFSNSNDD